MNGLSFYTMEKILKILKKKFIEWKLYGPLLEIQCILIIHNNRIFPYHGYSIEIVWIYYGFSGAIANFIVWISHFSPVTMNTW
jgi:hypothetical protein